MLPVFHAVGYKLGEWHDVAWWQMSLRQHRTTEPKPPQTREDIAGQHE